jgi:hypothetical protein
MKKLAFFLLLSLFAYGQEPWSGTITIGTFRYLGTSPQGTSQYEAFFDTTGVTAKPLTIYWMNMIVGPSAMQFEQFTTPKLFEEYGSDSYETLLWPCGTCAVIALQLQLSENGHSTTLTLANGDTFRTAGFITVVLQALPGKFWLMKYQSVPIVLTQIRGN